MRGGLAIGSLLVAACAGPARQGTRPSFPQPRAGVFQDAVPVVKSTDDDLLPSIAPHSGVIAYAAKIERNLDIYTRPLGGGAAVRLTTHSTDDTDPELSVDGQQIAWTSLADDVKGDIWIMDADGSGKRRLTDRTTADRSPTWSSDGRRVFFTARARGMAPDRIDVFDVEEGKRTTVVERGWDPAVSGDGNYLFYVALDERPQPRLFVVRLEDGQVAALTDGAFIEGLPRVARGVSGTRVLFTRWVDDQTGDGTIDVDDSPSLWSVDFDENLFDRGEPAATRPLTAGDGGEAFASALADWMVYTTSGFGDLEIYALPADGVVNTSAEPEVILAAARSEDNAELRRLALRYLVATTPGLAASARYELARELAERERFRDAIDELGRVIEVAEGDELEGVARLEIERLRMLERLRGSLIAREEGERRFASERIADAQTIAKQFPNARPVKVRARILIAEAEYALGRRDRAMAAFADTAHQNDVPEEDGARALDRMGEVLSRIGDIDAVARLSEATLRRFPGQRYYARRAADRWVAAAQASSGEPGLAALEKIVRQHHDLPTVAARAAAALARAQQEAHHNEAALEQYKRIAADYPSERAIQADALVTLGEAAERQGRRSEAIEAYERLIAEFPERAEVRSRALHGLTRIALEKARVEDRAGELERARQSYVRLLRNNRELVYAHRRYIALSARLDKLEPVLAEYQSAAEKRPRDKYARYGYGYALLFEKKPPLTKAQREIEAALGLDPRMAVAHLTLGWIREQRHMKDPRGGWLEKASSSYETAWSLFDAKVDTELWAAAKLNHGNALFRLNKTDLAFEAYLARELSQVPFDDPITELLFRQRFAQTALREQAFDVAQDMAHLGFAHATRLPGQPRRASLAALIAAISLLTGSYEDATIWYARARSIYEEQGDSQRIIPMLRGEALAFGALQRHDQALAAWTEIIDRLQRGQGADARYCWDKPAIRLLGIWIPMRLGMLDAELPTDATNVTAAICGFSAEQEEEIANAAAMRIASTRGYITRARAFAARRLEIMREAVADSRRGDRIERELCYALDASARLAVRAGELDEAQQHWSEALVLARKLGRWINVAAIVESLAQLWARVPGGRTARFADEALLAAGEGLNQTAASNPRLSRRFARWLALYSLAEAARPPVISASDGEQRFSELLSHLDAATEASELALAHARLAVSDQPGELDVRPAIEGYRGARKAQTLEARQQAIHDAPPDWRTCFDRALWDHLPDERGPASDWLLAAVVAFEKQPQPARVPERGAFLAAAVQMLVERHEIERAWRLLERDRLLELQPPFARVSRADQREQWEHVRDARSEPDAYREALARAPALVRALEGVPATLAEVQESLEGRAFLLQVFAPLAGQVHFFVVAAAGISHVQATSLVSIPEALLEPLTQKSSEGALSLYLDIGDLMARPAALLRGRKTLPESLRISEVLSATYHVAAWQKRNLARDGVLTLGGAGGLPAGQDILAKQGVGRRLIHILGPAKYQRAPLERVGLAQLELESPGLPYARRLDLDTIAGLELSSNVAVVDRLPEGAAPARALAQAFLLAGVPSLIASSERVEPAMVSTLVAALKQGRLIDAIHNLSPEGEADLRLIGYQGATFAERVDLALEQYQRLDHQGRALYREASRSKDEMVWRAARRTYESLLDTLDFLKQPDATKLMQQTGDPKIKTIATKIETLEVQRQMVLAQVLINLGEVDEAVVRQDRVADTFIKTGLLKPAVKVLNFVGQNLASKGRHQEAVDRYVRCITYARQTAYVSQEADCLSRLASQKRALGDYDAAARHYQRALELLAKQPSDDLVLVHRYFGYLYESSMNEYGKALEQFETALEIARTLKLSGRIPGLMLDIARIHRTRGHYEQALVRALEAEEQLAQAPERERANVALELAKIYWYRGNYRRALGKQKVGLELAQHARDTFLEIQAISLAGLIALNQGELERGERSIRDALHLSRVTERTAEEAKQLNNLGIILREAGRIPEAISAFREALKIDEQLGSAEGRAYDLRNLAVALHRQGDLNKALARVSEALELSRSIGEQYNQLQALFAAGEILESLEDPQSGRRYSEAAALARRRSVPEVEWRSLYALGRLSRASGNRKKARSYFDRALAVAEHLGRGQSGTGGEHTRDDLYADALELAIEDNDLESAHLYIERSRSRLLLDVLASRTITLGKAQAAAMERELRARESLMAARRDADLRVEGATERLARAETEHARAWRDLRDRYPRLARTFTIDPVPLDQLRSLLPEGVVVGSFFVGSQRTTVLVITHKGVQSVELELGRVDLSKRVRRLRAAMRAFGAVDDGIRELAGLLVGPLEDALLGARTLVVLPHGPLHHVPFAALPLGGEPLLMRMVIATAPSGSVLADQLRLPARPRPRSIVVLAPANDLPFADLEARAIAGDRALVGKSATESALGAVWADALDLAAHGELDAKDPLSSTLLMQPGGNDDGRLELHEIFALDHVPSLVTLSACDSASGDVQGNEWLGLGGAFLTTGARTVIASANRVSDLAAAVLMKRFYRALRRQSAGEALQRAALITRRYFPHPAHWANFVLVGDFR